MKDYIIDYSINKSAIIEKNTVNKAPIKFKHRQPISTLKYITKFKICDIQAEQKTEFDFIFFIKNPTKNIPSIVP